MGGIVKIRSVYCSDWRDPGASEIVPITTLSKPILSGVYPPTAGFTGTTGGAVAARLTGEFGWCRFDFTNIIALGRHGTLNYDLIDPIENYIKPGEIYEVGMNCVYDKHTKEWLPVVGLGVLQAGGSTPDFYLKITNNTKFVWTKSRIHWWSGPRLIMVRATQLGPDISEVENNRGFGTLYLIGSNKFRGKINPGDTVTVKFTGSVVESAIPGNLMVLKIRFMSEVR